MLAIFAGPVISDTAFYSIIGVSFLTVASFAAVVLSLLSKFLSRNTKSVRKISIQKSLLITTSVIVVGALVFIVIPPF